MDLADSHVAALKKMFAADFFGVKIYNLGTGEGNSVLEMVKAFEEASGEYNINLFFVKLKFSLKKPQHFYKFQENQFHMK